MNYAMILYVLSSVLTFEGFFLMLPALVGAIYGETEVKAYFIVAVCCIIIGILGRLKKPKSKVFYSKEGFVSVSASWVLLSLVGALPFVITGEIPFYVDALFETISGFTTTGSSILTDVEALSHASLFWRSFTHWIGGMGVLVFIMAILPTSGGSDMHLMRAESPGPSVGKLVPKLKQTAMILYAIYMGITIVEIIALLLAGLNLFESMTLTFGTVGTGGFGILNSSIASYNVAVQIIITIFMLLCSINFTFFYLILARRAKEAFGMEEVRAFAIIVFAAILLISLNIMSSVGNFWDALRLAAFQVASIISTSGYVTTDFSLWPAFSQAILLLFMFLGACAGSTGGGFKVSRIVLLVKAVKNEIHSFIHPRSVRKVYNDKKSVSTEVVKQVLVYLAVYVLIYVLSVLVVSLDGKDMLTNISGVAATFNNIGPGLGNVVGPVGNFSNFSVLSKLVFIFDMLVGRLEIFPVLVLFSAATWKLPFRSSDKKMEKMAYQ